MKKVCDAIDHNPGISRKELQIEAGLSRSRLDELFKREVGVRLGVYIRERRMELASKLLVTSEQAIKEIADRIGYEHASSFIRVFTLFFGMSPTDYRRSNRQNC